MDIGVLGLTVLVMALIGMGLEVSQLRCVLKSRAQLASMLIGQVLVLPAIALALVRVLALPVQLSAGLLLVAACPVGNIANFYALLARGNLALYVRNVGLATAIAVTLLNRLEYAAFVSVYFVLQVPLLLLLVTAYRHWSSRSRFTLAVAPKPE